MSIRIASLIFLLAACEPMVAHRGHIRHQDLLEDISTGMEQSEVMQRFGSPSSRSQFGEPVWYYIQSRKEARGFLKPQITEQQVIAVRFDSYGLVTEVENYSLDDRQNIALVDKVTPTEGHSIGFFEQALGNIGRFNNTRDRSVDPRGPPGR